MRKYLGRRNELALLEEKYYNMRYIVLTITSKYIDYFFNKKTGLSDCLLPDSTEDLFLIHMFW